MLHNWKNRITPPGIIENLPEGKIFVFGSNQSGRHGKGAAKKALTWGAIWGQAEGLQGRTYGIPTKNKSVKRILSVKEIQPYVDRYIEFCKQHPEMIFWTTEIGCGLSKYKPKHIAPLFEAAIPVQNICFTERFWHKLIKEEQNIETTV